MDNIQSILKQLKDTGEQYYSKICIVRRTVSFYLTIDVEPIDSLHFNPLKPNPSNYIYDVQLNPTTPILTEGTYSIPLLGSYVIVTFMNKYKAFVSMYSNREKFTLVASKIKVKVSPEVLSIENFDVFKISTTLNLEDNIDITDIQINNINSILLKSNDNTVELNPLNIGIKTLDDKIRLAKVDKTVEVEAKTNYKDAKKDIVKLWRYGVYYYNNYLVYKADFVDIATLGNNKTYSTYFPYSEFQTYINDIVVKYIEYSMLLLVGWDKLEETKTSFDKILKDKGLDDYTNFNQFYKELYLTSIYTLKTELYSTLEYLDTKLKEDPKLIETLHFESALPIFDGDMNATNHELSQEAFDIKYEELFTGYDLQFYKDFIKALLPDIKEVIDLIRYTRPETYNIKPETFISLDALYNVYFTKHLNIIRAFGLTIQIEDINKIEANKPSILLTSNTKLSQIQDYFRKVIELLLNIYENYNSPLSIKSSKSEIVIISFIDILNDLNNALQSAVFSDTAIPLSGPLVPTKLILNNTNIPGLFK